MWTLLGVVIVVVVVIVVSVLGDVVVAMVVDGWLAWCLSIYLSVCLSFREILNRSDFRIRCT